jgi:hypothetical protein
MPKASAPSVMKDPTVALFHFDSDILIKQLALYPNTVDATHAGASDDKDGIT